MEMEEIVFSLILYSGEARSLSMKAIKKSIEEKFEECVKLLEDADKKLIEAHKIQTNLIQREINGEMKEISLILIHAQDHLMTSITIHDLAKEFIKLAKKVK